MSSKIYYGKIQPNSKEYKIWVDVKGVIRTFDGQKWNQMVTNNNQSESPQLIQFTVNNKQYTALSKMNWIDFVNSEYNVDNFYTEFDGASTFIITNTTGSDFFPIYCYVLNPTTGIPVLGKDLIEKDGIYPVNNFGMEQ